MKKSLVILSISLILLISISFISAGWFGGKSTGTAIQAPPAPGGNPTNDYLIGDTFETLNGDQATINDVVGGEVQFTLIGSKGTRTFSLAETESDSLSGILVNQINNPLFFGATTITITLREPIESLFSGGELTPNEPIDTNNPASGSCESFDIEELYISRGNVGNEILNNRFIDFDDDEILTVNELFSYPLKEGNKYYVPITNQQCYWEASYEDGELYMITVCPPAE